MMPVPSSWVSEWADSLHGFEPSAASASQVEEVSDDLGEEEAREIASDFPDSQREDVVLITTNQRSIRAVTK